MLQASELAEGEVLLPVLGHGIIDEETSALRALGYRTSLWRRGLTKHL